MIRVGEIITSQQKLLPEEHSSRTVNLSVGDGGAEGGQQVPLQHAGSHTLATERDWIWGS